MTRGALLLLVAVTIATRCTTYHASGATGGFSETRLSDVSYRVSFRGNGYTSAARVESFMLRRSAELALEHGYRYFLIDMPANLDRHDFWRQYSERGVTVRFLNEQTPESADAVVVIQETNDVAGDRLSPAASATLQKLQRADG